MAAYQIGEKFRVFAGKEKTGYPRYRWFAVFRCECGLGFVARCRGDAAVSCGCVLRKDAAERAKTQSHAKTHGLSESETYRTWCHIKDRCNNPNDKRYADYGGRGITVCERWRTFENFIEDMGERPEGTSIDRINPDGNYEPGNCRWAGKIEQARNKRNNVVLTIDGESKTVAEWCENPAAAKDTTVYKRVKIGWPAKEAVFGQNK